MSDFNLELAALLSRAAGDPYQMLNLHRLAEQLGYRTGFEHDEDLVAALVGVGSRDRLFPELILDDDHLGSWATGEVSGEEAPEAAEDELTARQSRPEPELDLDQARQAATLVAAAEDGTPFCEECERARQSQANAA